LNFNTKNGVTSLKFIVKWKEKLQVVSGGGATRFDVQG
jgi:hypothetical protein